MQTQCNAEQLQFFKVGRREVVGAFDGGRVSSDAGALLLGKADMAIGLIDRLAGCFADGRNAQLIEHSVRTLVGQRVFGMALGYEDLNDHEQLRHDPVMGALLGKLEAQRRRCAPLAGKSTLNRLELFADRLSTETFRANQLRLWLSSAAYVLMHAVRRIGLKNTVLAHACAHTIRLRLLKIGALITVSVRRVRLAMSEACPNQHEFIAAFH